MWIPQDNSFSAKFQYVELAYWDERARKVIREQDNHQPIMLSVHDLDAWRKKRNNYGVYTSIGQYERPDITSAKLSNLYFDLDNKDDIGVPLEDGIKLIEYLKAFIPLEALRIYFSGRKGLHIEAEAICLGVTPHSELHNIFRFIANHANKELDLTSLDFATYDARRMWRLPNSQHQDSFDYKREIALDDLKAGKERIKVLVCTPNEEEVPPQKFNYKANEWYRNFIYKKEEKPKADPIELFSKYGTGVKSKDESKRRFDPKKLFDNCPVILELWAKSEREHDLAHEERLFLCSILSYTDEALEYLYIILQNCDDYNEDKTRAHIEDWIRRREQKIGGRPYTCRRARDAGIMCSGCDKLEPQYKIERVGSRFIKTDEIAEPSPIRYCYYIED